MSVFFNELHYDDDGADAGEFFEIAGPAGTDLAGFSVALYNGANGEVYATVPLSGVLGDAGHGFGFLAFSQPGIQNGAPDGLALVDPTDTVLEFLSYEGVFAAVDGPAAGMTSTDIGVSESGAEAEGLSLQRTGTGAEAADFTFAAPEAETPNAVNAGQTFEAPTFDLQITEIWPGNDPGSNLTEDWFEVTNVGDAAWTIADGALFYDDDSQDAGAADPLSGVVEIAPGESVVFVNDSTTDEFVAVWGGVIELGQVGTFDGSGLSQGGDGVTLFLDAAGDGVDAVDLIDFEAYPDAEADGGRSFDVLAGAFSTDGGAGDGVVTTGAVNDESQPAVGSPTDGDEITTVVPASDFTLELLHFTDQEAATGAIVDAPNLSAVLNALRNEDLGGDGVADNTLTLSSGDAFIPGVFFSSSAAVYGLEGVVDVQIQNELGVQAVALGNHEFDLGSGHLAQLIAGDASIVFDQDLFIGTDLENATFDGTAFPYLSSNLDFSTQADLAPLEVAGGQAPTSNSVTSSTVIDVNGELIGVVGATTPTLGSISSPGALGVSPQPFDSNPTPEQLDALAAIIQAEVDALLAANAGMDKVILLAHMQKISIELGLAERLENVDIIVAGGSNTRLFDDNDRIRAGDSDQGQYPQFVTNAGGAQTAVVNTDGSYKYVGRLVLDFDADGNVIPESYDQDVSGAYATDAQGVTDLGAEGLIDPEIQALVDVIEEQIIATESNVFGISEVFLNGNRSGVADDPADTDGVRTQETNLGNLTADANLAAAQETDAATVISIKNGGGIRASVGETVVPPGETEAVRLPNGELLDGDGNVIKPEGGISQNDIQTTLAFNNNLVLLTLTAEEIVGLLEHGVSALPGVAGQFPQISGLKFSFDPDSPEGDRIENAGVFDENDQLIAELVRDGEVVNPAAEFRVVTLGFLAESRFDGDGNFIGGGDGYPFPNLNDDPNVGEVGDPAVIARANFVALDAGGVQTGDATFADDGTEQDALAEFLDDNFADAANAFDQEDTGRDQDKRIQNLNFRADEVFEAVASFDLQITEIWPGNEPGSNLTEDWFEVTNVGDAAWTIADGALFYDDDSQDAGAADLLSGVVEIAPGESVVFVNDSTTDEFVAVWGGVIELGQVGTFDGSGLSQGGDGVTLFLDAAGDGVDAGDLIDFEAYPNAEANGGQSFDVDAGAFSVDGGAGDGVVTTNVVNDADQPAVGSPTNGAEISGDVPPAIVISEIMYNPASAEDDWEWIEIANVGAVAVDLAGWVLDDGNGVFHAGATIAAGTIEAGGTAVLFNADDVTAEQFADAWGDGLNLVAVTDWGANALNNGGDTVALWESFADYSGDEATFANAVDSVVYDNGVFPIDDGAASIFLTDLGADNDDGANWALSTVGGATPAGEGRQSAAEGGNSGADVGSPGGDPEGDGEDIGAPQPINELAIAAIGTVALPGSEIVDFDPASGRAFVTSGDGLLIVDASDPANPFLLATIDPETLGGAFDSSAVTSATFKNDILAIAVPDATVTDNGHVLFFQASTLAFLGSVEVGPLPDAVVFNAEGTHVVVSNEGQSASGDNLPDALPNPGGSVSIIEINSEDLSASTVTTLDFTDPSITFDALEAKGVRVNRDAPDAAADIEPEYAAIVGNTAFVALQENNAVAVIPDITNPTPFTIDSIQPSGLQDHSVEGFGLDPSNEDGGVNIANFDIFGLREPDGIASYEVGGVKFYVTANEGDGREVDESRGADLVDGDLSNGEVDAGLDPDLLAALADDALLGRLKFSNVDGDTDGDGDIDVLHSFGSRSFTIFDEFGNIVFDSGDDFERITAEQVPEIFNSDESSPGEFDERSDDKGPEPESVVLGEIDGATYAFIALERTGGIMVYDVTDPSAPAFEQYIRNEGDIAPEGLKFIPAEDSPTGLPLLAVANEVSNTLTFHEITPEGGLAIPISEIQADGHVSPFVLGDGQTTEAFFASLPASTFNILGDEVATRGIVTAVDDNGFYLQDPTGDGDDATSDAIFVFTGGAPTVAVGDDVRVAGTVAEFFPGGTGARNLSTTEIVDPSVKVLSSGNDLPASTLLGQGGRAVPDVSIDDDAFADFDPANDGIDFFESLEGMLVTAQDLGVVNGTNRFGEIFTVVDQGADASGLSDRGTINISPDDFNPERVQIDFGSDVGPGQDAPAANVGDSLGDVTGVISYNFGNFEILPTEEVTVTPTSTLTPETTALVGTDDQLTVATYNVLNLDPNDADGDADVADGRFQEIAEQIVQNLGSPDVIGLQEIQDNSGSLIDGVTSASETLALLVQAIADAGGPAYAFIDNTFIVDEASGGQPGGNIRTAFLFNPDRVDLVDGSVRPVGGQEAGEAFVGARLPLAADFVFNGEVVTVVNNHFSSKGGSAPILGIEQDFAARQEEPDVNGSLNERRVQAQAVNNFVDSLLAAAAGANVVVLGDMNEFEFVSPLQILEGTVESAPNGFETTAGGDQVLTNLVNVIDEDERYSFIFQGNSQSLDHILTSAGLLEGAEIDIVHVNSEFAETDGRASDHDPLVARLTIPSQDDVLIGDNGPNELNGGAGDDRIVGLNGDDILRGNDGEDVLNGGNGKDRLLGGAGDDAIIGGNGDDYINGGAGNDSANGDNGDDILLGREGDDILRGNNGEDIANGNEGNDFLRGGSGDDILRGNEGMDELRGENGNDILFGGADSDILRGGKGADKLRGDEGDDVLRGEEGADILDGSLGLDTLIGGAGADIFMLRFDDATDVIVDFEIGVDMLSFASGGSAVGTATDFGSGASAGVLVESEGVSAMLLGLSGVDFDQLI